MSIQNSFIFNPSTLLSFYSFSKFLKYLNNTEVFNSAQDTLGITTGAIILEFLIKPHFSGRDICFDLFYLLDFPHGVYLMN